MNYKTIFATIFFSAVAFVGLLIWKPTHTSSPHTLTIVCTTSIIADAVRTIAGSCATVTSLMGPNIDPHVYRARESDVQALAHADIIFYNGLHLEGKMAQILEKMGNYAATYAVSDALGYAQLRVNSDFAGCYDPHLWLDVHCWMRVVEYIAKILERHDPAHTQMYADNARVYLQQLENLDSYIKSRIAAVARNQRILITAHDAFGYFGAAYAITVVGLQGLSTQSEVTIQDITKLVDCIVNNRIKAIFVESAISPQAITAVQNAARSRGWDVSIGAPLYTDALGGAGSQAQTYLAMMRYNVDAMVAGLSGSQKS